MQCSLTCWLFAHESIGEWLRELTLAFKKHLEACLSDWGTYQCPTHHHRICMWLTDLLQLRFFSNKTWYIWPKKKKKRKKLSEHQFPFGIEIFCFFFFFHKAAAWQVAAYFGGKKPNSFFIADVCFTKEQFPPPAAFSPPESITGYFGTSVPLSCNDCPNIDANIVFFIRSTSHAHMVT